MESLGTKVIVHKLCLVKHSKHISLKMLLVIYTFPDSSTFGDHLGSQEAANIG